VNALLRAWAASVLVALALAIAIPGHASADAPPSAAVNAQLLALGNGYIFLTSGETYRLAPDVAFLDPKGQKTAQKPEAGSFVKLTFDAQGTVIAIAQATRSEKSSGDLAKYSLLPPFAQPPGPLASAHPLPATVLRDLRVTVAFTVEVPTTTLGTDQIYMATSETSWNPLAIRFDRIDSQHFRAVMLVPAGSRFRYLYTRGSSQSLERGRNGLQRKPRELVLDTVQARSIADRVDHWGDEAGTGLFPNPQASPTPYNPAPYPNLPPNHINPAKPASTH